MNSTAATPAATATTTAAASNASVLTSGSSILGGRSGGSSAGSVLHPTALSANTAQFREIHKNTWLKRLTAEGKKITVGPKKSERSWVVFCVHDDTDALLEGYAEPRQAAAHAPEWIVSLQDTLHISHSLIPNSHEFEFVVTLSNEVVRFHAISWEIMQEWVETLRSKLREMKILSPRENLYTKLPEIRAPLLPTRDPTSPLPAPPPVPAALVPGVERVIPQSSLQDTTPAVSAQSVNGNTTTTNPNTATTTTSAIAAEEIQITGSSSRSTLINNTASTSTTSITAAPVPTALTAMSNTLTQNLLNMLSDPLSTYSEQISDVSANDEYDEDEMEEVSLNDVGESFSDLSLDYLSPLLRKSIALQNAQTSYSLASTSSSSSADPRSVRVDIGAQYRLSADQIKNFRSFIPRPQTSRSLSAGAADQTRKQIPTSSNAEGISNALTSSSSNNVTELEILSEPLSASPSKSFTSTPSTSAADAKANITIIQVSTNNETEAVVLAEPPKLPKKSITGEIFKFPDTHTTSNSKHLLGTKQLEYKSNVQIIPSNSKTNSSTIQVLGHSPISKPNTKNNQYTAAPVKAATSRVTPSINEEQQIHKGTTVHVAGAKENHSKTTITGMEAGATAISIYGTCYEDDANNSSIASCSSSSTQTQSTPKLTKKIILSANATGITNINVDSGNSHQTIGESSDAVNKEEALKHIACKNQYGKVFVTASPSVEPTTSSSATSRTTAAMSPRLTAHWSSPKRHTEEQPTSSSQLLSNEGTASDSLTSTPTAITKASSKQLKNSSTSNSQQVVSVSPIMPRRRIVSPSNINVPRPPYMLTRGLTEAVISTRPSRRDFHFLKGASPTKTKTKSSNSKNTVFNNNVENAAVISSGAHSTPVHAAVNRTASEALELRKRSSSTSDARNVRGTNNNECLTSTSSNAGAAAVVSSKRGGFTRMQQPPQPIRGIENGSSSVGPGGGRFGGAISPPSVNASSAPKRMTLREQQVMQLRREIMHPGGVRLQLRRKDCLGSIAWVDAFCAVWVAGWKQKEYPVLYNALHIGDQLLSIAGITISTAAEANKVIRSSNTLFVEMLVRRIPFGRAYAIRRDREGQCLGLIRDGNTTIVDVVPNSLAARHGLPPKAQSTDGTTLTFWVLTEINARPLNLFFKDTEIRDRLNSVGRDISILVQPSDLIAKLKKQLKSMRSYKDYLVQ